MGRLKRSPAHDTLRIPADAHLPLDTERQLSPGLTANLPSNNPFRNRAASPANSPITSTFSNIPHTAPERPTSRNPFLDQTGKQASSTVQVRTASPEKATSSLAGRMPPTKPALTGHAVELFVSATLASTISILLVLMSAFRTILPSATDPRHLRTMSRKASLKVGLYHTPIVPHDQRICHRSRGTG